MRPLGGERSAVIKSGSGVWEALLSCILKAADINVWTRIFFFVSFGLVVKPILLRGPNGGRIPMGKKLQQWALRSYLGCSITNGFRA